MSSNKRFSLKKHVSLLYRMMGADKRLGRAERRGRYGSDRRRDDHDRHKRQSREAARIFDWRRCRGDGRLREYYDDCRDGGSPRRSRKRHHSGRFEDEYDEDKMDEEDEGGDEECKTIILRGLAPHVTEEDIRSVLEELEGPHPVDVRLMKKRAGISRSFAFVEFYHLQDSTRWMETYQNKLVIHGKTITMVYSNKMQKFGNWLCSACNLYNFRKRLKCFRCGATKVEGDSPDNSSSSEPQQPGEFSIDTLILRNISQTSTVEGILNIFAPYASLSAANIRLIKDKQTGQNRGFAFVQLSSNLEASQLLTCIQSLQPPLKLDGKTIAVDFAKSSRKDLAPPDGFRANARSVASTAIAAAQWSSSQLKQRPVAAMDITLQEPTQLWQQQPEGSARVGGDGLLGAAPGVKTLIPTGMGVVISQAPQIYQPVIISQPAIQLVKPVDAEQQTANVSTTFPEMPAASTAATTVCTAPASTPSAVPDTSRYQYDKSSGYYYDPHTGLYYDANSKYFYNATTRQYLYWDSEKQTYVPVPAASETSTGQAPAATPPVTTTTKEKKEKPKSKSAQQIAKDMERWAKSLNKQKESLKNSCQDSESSKEEDKKESAAADAGFFLFAKKHLGGFDMHALMAEQFRILEQEAAAKSEQVTFNYEDSDPEEGCSYRTADEEGVTDWKKIVCLLCRRQFPNKEGLLRHQQLSDLHKQNLEIQRRSRLSEFELDELQRAETEQMERELMYRDRAAERREKYGIPEPPVMKKQFYQPPAPAVNYDQPTKDGLTSDNIGNKILQAMGWQEGKGLGRHHQGITQPVSASLRAEGTGLGIKGSSYELSASDTYKDAVRKAMFARFTEIE